MKNTLIAISLFLSGLAMGADEANPFTVAWNCAETPACSTENGNYTGGYALIGNTYYADGGSASSCCHIGNNIWRMACQDGVDPKGAVVQCQ